MDSCNNSRESGLHSRKATNHTKCIDLDSEQFFPIKTHDAFFHVSRFSCTSELPPSGPIDPQMVVFVRILGEHHSFVV